MIVSESDILVAALDRRLRVDAPLPVEARGPIAGSADEPRSPGSPSTQPGPSAAAPSDAFVERLPLGTNVAARIVAVPSPNHVVAEIAGLVVELSWPGTPVPTPGLVVALRVLSHEPLLLFESTLVDEASRDDATDTPTRLSPGALRLSPGSGGGAPIRFDVPILEIEIVPVHRDDGSSGNAARDGSNRIALDDVVVGRGGLLPETSAASSNPLDAAATSAVLPMILLGPAWRGQDVELIVRRERADESFDNPVLDQWCGDLVIDLPNLGRVAGHLAWSMQGLRIRLEGDEHGTVESMAAAAAELATALATVDLPVVSMSVSEPFADASMNRHA